MMDKRELAAHILSHQQISRHDFKTAGELVSWLGAVQAQDFMGAKWSLGLRLPHAKEQDIEKAIQDKEIIRTWTQRGTWHFVSPQNIYWMLDLVAERVIRSAASRFRQLGLDAKLLAKSNDILAKATANGNALTRKELGEILLQHHIPTSDFRLTYMVQNAVYDGIICLGPRRNKEFAFVSLPEWVPEINRLPKEASIIKLSGLYFNSHGPATIADFKWWSGLNQAEAMIGLEAIKPGLKQETIEGQVYWMPKDQEVYAPEKNTGIYLLPGFDEYLLGYKDRSPMIDAAHSNKVFNGGNAIFANTIVSKGRVIGTWKRTIQKNEIQFQINPFEKLSKTTEKGIEKAMKQFGTFWGMPIKL